VLTVDGQAQIVVQSADAYRQLMEDHELLESIRGISRGMEEAKRLERKPMREFLESLAKGHGISLR
jgi:PHD/YefM family antitoxin component YafN of YafNO toxin-antitoxin module